MRGIALASPIPRAELLQRLRTVAGVVFDFDGVFTDNTVSVDQHGVESVRCWRSDGLGLANLRKLGVETAIISTERNPVVSFRARKLDMECIQAVEDKAVAIAEWAAKLQLPLSRIGFVGNDINDIPALRKVGLPIGVADAHEDILSFIVYRTERPGGYGAVREVCDLIAAAHAPGEAGPP